MGLTATKYKETEVGLIPEDWDLVPLNKVFTFHSTSNYSKAQMSDDNEVGCIHYGLIHEIPDTQYNLKNGIKYYVSSDQAKYDIVRDGDVIMVDASEDLEGVNKSVEVYGIGNKKYISGLHTYLLRDTNGSLAENFRGILLNSQLVKNQMLQLAVGMKVFGVSKTQLIKVKLPLPPTVNEQKAIAQVLTDTEALIQALEKKITKKKLIKKGVMQKLLTPKEHWEEKILGELAEFYKGRGLPKSEIIEEGKYKCLHYGELFTKYKEEIRTILSKTNTLENVFFSKSNDVLMPTSDVTPNGLATASCIREDNIILSGDVLVIRIPNQIINGIFLSYYISQNRKQVMKLVSGSTVYHLYGSDMSKFVLSYPNIEEQNLIVQTLTDMDKEIAQLEEKLSKYQLAKQGIMQQLLTGKIRLV